MEVIDVTVDGGPDVAAVVGRRSERGGVRLDLALDNSGPGPARISRVAVIVQSQPVRAVVADDGLAGGRPVRSRPDGLVPGGPVAVTDAGVVGWLAGHRHRASVVVHRDGWLITAWAELDGVVLAPGEVYPLDPLWLGDGPPGPALLAWADVAAAEDPPPPVGPTVGWWAGGWPPADVIRRLDAAAAAGVGLVLIDLPPEDQRSALAGLVEAIRDSGLVAGVAVAPFAPHRAGSGRRAPALIPASAAGPVLDLTHPAALLAVEDLGLHLAGAGVGWVTVTGATDAGRPAPRWGDAAIPAHAALRNGYAALVTGLGPDVVVHAADGPLAAAAGLAAVVTVGPGPLDPEGRAALVWRAAHHGRRWTAAPGVLDPEGPAGPVDPDTVELLAALSGCQLVAGDPRRWDPGVRSLVARLAEARTSIDTVDRCDLFVGRPRMEVDGRIWEG